MVKPGSYPCVIGHPGGSHLAGQLELAPGQDPQGQVFDWPVPEDGGVRILPQPVERFPFLVCALRAGWEVVLLDVKVRALLPGQSSFQASLAVAGHGLTPILAERSRKQACRSPKVTGSMQGHR